MHRLPVITVIVTLASAVLFADGATAEPPISPDDRQHWSYQTLKRPAVPEVQNVQWPRNAVDRFILAKLEEIGLQPAPEADRRTLVRRLHFDLTGLPPTPGQIDAFINDEAPDAYERLVDRLLASPEYGERQALYWLDLARFAETDGFEHDKVRKHAWRYRDWLIAALNDDLPYDDFVKLQLAADQFRPDDQSAREALGFLQAGPDMPDINLQDERRHAFMNDMTSTVGSVFLGLQFGCAQCHDHKYDAISQRDFYRLRAFFDPYFKFTLNRNAVMADVVKTQTVSHLMVRGDFRQKGPELQPAFLRVVAPEDFRPETTLENRRKVLANWLTRDDHPLATRVIVNRLWQSHFGRGLSGASSDFGVMGDQPFHINLLNWLATELPRRDWSMKSVHRMIVTSATYRQVSRVPADAAPRAAWDKSLEDDPTNLFWARFPRQRLEGEAIRDAMLAVSGNLSQRRGGPGVRPPLPQELVSTLLRNHWPVSKDERDHRRRSVYVFVRRNLRYPIFHAFDKPDNNASCAKRNRSTTAPQALLLINSEFSQEAAGRLAEFVLQKAGDDPAAQVDLAYRRTLGRKPTEGERKLALQFLEQDERQLGDDSKSADASRSSLSQLCLVLFNLNEFLYVD